jgi:hypothetical protein
MRTGFVSAIIVLALAFAIIAGVTESRLLTRALVIGFVPAIWAASSVLERFAGRDMWKFAAPYPYRWMREAGDTAALQPHVSRKPVEDPLEPDDQSAVSLAA